MCSCVCVCRSLAHIVHVLLLLLLQLRLRRLPCRLSLCRRLPRLRQEDEGGLGSRSAAQEGRLEGEAKKSPRSGSASVALPRQNKNPHLVPPQRAPATPAHPQATPHNNSIFRRFASLPSMQRGPRRARHLPRQRSRLGLWI